MPITLTHGAQTLTLPVAADQLEWVDEYSWSPVSQERSISLTGALLIEEAVQQAGRPITLVGADDRAWCTRALLLSLMAWAADPGREMQLTLADGRVFDVMFDHAAGAIDARPVLYQVPVSDDDPCVVSALRFVEI